MNTEDKYPRGVSFPNEGFVQNALEEYFLGKGWRLLETDSCIDLVCEEPDTCDRWQIEAKGDSKNTTTDFHTGLGQLVHRMCDEHCKHGLAIPRTPQFLRLCNAVQPWVRARLGLHFLIVNADGDVQILAPKDPLPNM